MPFCVAATPQGSASARTFRLLPSLCPGLVVDAEGRSGIRSQSSRPHKCRWALVGAVFGGPRTNLVRDSIFRERPLGSSNPCSCVSGGGRQPEVVHHGFLNKRTVIRGPSNRKGSKRFGEHPEGRRLADGLPASSFDVVGCQPLVGRYIPPWRPCRRPPTPSQHGSERGRGFRA